MQRVLFSFSLLSERGANGNEAVPVEGMAVLPSPFPLPLHPRCHSTGSKPASHQAGGEGAEMAKVRVRVGDALQRLVRPGSGHLASCYQQPVGPKWAFCPGARGVCGDAQSYLLQCLGQLLQLVPIWFLTGTLGQYFFGSLAIVLR